MSTMELTLGKMKSLMAKQLMAHTMFCCQTVECKTSNIVQIITLDT